MCKRDSVNTVDADGVLVQDDLDETYYYTIDRPDGYALQRIYTDADSPLHRAGHPIDATVIARNDDAVLIPEGYQPTVSYTQLPMPTHETGKTTMDAATENTKGASL